VSPTCTDYHVVNGLGVTVYTSPDIELAKREAARRARNGCAVEVREVQVFTVSRRVYRPRPALCAA
jgi:hypothetical protein